MKIVYSKEPKIERCSEIMNFSRQKTAGLYNPQNEHDSCGVGFIASIKGDKTHQIVLDGLKILENLEHRGAVGADPLMGDGAGIMLQIPDKFFREKLLLDGVTLPAEGEYGIGMVFLPKEQGAQLACERAIERAIIEEDRFYWDGEPCRLIALFLCRQE